ncbi:MAG TPA: phosphoribulokinase [Phaeodactylibacter sp.]|nr:phosphoribulokinase [Phaeodactylibacter sp.]
MDYKTILLGIIGDSAAGKTTLTRGIVELLGPENVTAICSDDYHKYNRKQRKEYGITAINPACNYIDIMEQHFLALKRGKPILKPIYNHSTGDFDPPVYVKPRRFIIIEGLLGAHTQKLRDILDVIVYLDPPEDLRAEWKIQRDTAKRGYTREQVLDALRAREEDSEAFIRPQKKYADFIVSFYPKQKRTGDERLNAKIAMNPAQPSEEFNSIIEKIKAAFENYPCERANNLPCLSISLEKWHGQPMEILDIHGEIGEEMTDELKQMLGHALHQKGVDLNMDKVGLFVKEGRQMISFPLALAQLTITYFLVQNLKKVEHAVEV